jgi:hypothetical protein
MGQVMIQTAIKTIDKFMTFNSLSGNQQVFSKAGTGPVYISRGICQKLFGKNLLLDERRDMLKESNCSEGRGDVLCSRREGVFTSVWIEV